MELQVNNFKGFFHIRCVVFVLFFSIWFTQIGQSLIVK